jgi:mono/diheme cytochrome c family protein
VTITLLRLAIAPALAVLSCACSGSPSPVTTPAASQLAIVSTSGGPLSAVAGDALPLKVVIVAPDGSMADLTASANVSWTAPGVVTALPPDSTAMSPIPPPDAEPTVAWIENPGRPDHASDLTNVLFVLDPGTVQNATVEISATVTGSSLPGSVTASVAIDPTPAGDWTNGATLYGASGANCAQCHGASGHGSPGAPEATTYTMAGDTYDFPAPGINAEPGNTAGNPAWNAALFAIAARADMDNGGLTLRVPMPDWLSEPNPATGQPLTTQDLADVYAFLKTQTH